MAKTVQVNCKCCGDEFTARVADRNRGWGKFCSKSCKAMIQTQKQRKAMAKGKIVFPKAYAQAKAEMDYDALTSDDLRILGASDLEIKIKESEECLDDCELGWDGHKFW